MSRGRPTADPSPADAQWGRKTLDRIRAKAPLYAEMAARAAKGLTPEPPEPPAPILDPATLTKRQRQQADKRQRRDAAERQRAASRETEAAHQEILDERAAPKVQREAVLASDGTMLRGPLVEVVNGRPIRVNQVARIAGVIGDTEGLPASFRDVIGDLGGRSPAITPARVGAARQLQDDWARVGGGVGVSAKDYAERFGGSFAGGLLDQGIMAQADARQRLDGALTWLGALCDIVVPVVLDCVPPTAWARQNGMSEKHAVGYLAAALTRLASFYARPVHRIMIAFERLLDDPEPAAGIRSVVADDVAARSPAFGGAGQTKAV